MIRNEGVGGGGGFLFQAEDGIRDLVRSRGLGDVYKRQFVTLHVGLGTFRPVKVDDVLEHEMHSEYYMVDKDCLLYTSDAADERSSVDLGGRRIIKKKTLVYTVGRVTYEIKT